MDSNECLDRLQRLGNRWILYTFYGYQENTGSDPVSTAIENNKDQGGQNPIHSNPPPWNPTAPSCQAGSMPPKGAKRTSAGGGGSTKKPKKGTSDLPAISPDNLRLPHMALFDKWLFLWVQLYNCVIKEVSTTKHELIFLGARTSETTTCASISSWKRNFKTRLKLLYFLACLQHRTQIAGHWFFDFGEKAHAIEFYMWIEQNFPADPSVCNTQTSIVTRLLETTACSKTDSSWFFCVRTYAKVKDIGSPGPIQVRPWHLPHRQDYGLRGTSDHVLLA